MTTTEQQIMQAYNEGKAARFAPDGQALAEFTAYFVNNYPGPDTIISKPEWHAPKIFAAAKRALLSAAPADHVRGVTEMVDEAKPVENSFQMRVQDGIAYFRNGHDIFKTNSVMWVDIAAPISAAETKPVAADVRRGEAESLSAEELVELMRADAAGGGGVSVFVMDAAADMLERLAAAPQQPAPADKDVIRDAALEEAAKICDLVWKVDFAAKAIRNLKSQPAPAVGADAARLFVPAADSDKLGVYVWLKKLDGTFFDKDVKLVRWPPLATYEKCFNSGYLLDLVPLVNAATAMPVQRQANSTDTELLDFLDCKADVVFDFEHARIGVDLPENFQGANTVREIIRVAIALQAGEQA